MGTGLNKTKREIVRMLRDDDFDLRRTHGKNDVWHRQRDNRTVIVPAKNDLSIHSVRSVYRQANWPYTENQARQAEAAQEVEIVVAENAPAPSLPGLPSPLMDSYQISFALEGEQQGPQQQHGAKEFGDEEKARAVAYAETNSIRAACKKYNVKRQTINQWRLQFSQYDDKQQLVKSKSSVIHRVRRRSREEMRKRLASQRARIALGIDPEVRERVLYMLAQGISSESIQALYGVSQKQIASLSGVSERIRKGVCAERRPASLEEKLAILERRVRDLERENEELKRQIH